jgi:hypothetical protein
MRKLGDPRQSCPPPLARGSEVILATCGGVPGVHVGFDDLQRINIGEHFIQTTKMLIKFE